MIDNPWFYAAAIPGVLITGISKGGFGGGLGVLAVPMMALVIDPVLAAAIMLPILCAMDIIGAVAYRRSIDWRNLRILVPAALVGIAIGTASFRYLDAAAIRLLVGTLAVGFAADHWLRGRLATAEPKGRSATKGGIWGSMAGFTSFLAHAGGPPVSVYLLPQRLNRTLFVGTTVYFFIIVNYVKLIPYAWLGQLSVANLAVTAVLLPLAPIGMLLGLWLHKHVSDTLFYQVCYILLAVTGMKLLWDGVTGLM